VNTNENTTDNESIKKPLKSDDDISYDNITFVDTQYMKQMVEDSPYFDKLNVLDLGARRTDSTTDYKFRYMKALQRFDSYQKARLNQLVNDVNQITINTKNFKDIPWKFAKVATTIEYGYPHTIGDVIVLTDAFFIDTYTYERQMSTLIHEKVHVYQRAHPEHTKEFAAMIGFQPVEINGELLNIVRNNPDISSHYVYKEKYIPVQVYLSYNPKNISESTMYLYDVKYNNIYKPNDVKDFDIPEYIPQRENPNEIMGCVIPMILLNQNKEDTFFKTATNWSNLYL
jgi:hypothetical protein